MAFKLAPESPLSSEIARAVREQLEKAIEAVGQRRTRPAERVRQGRTGSKKVRAALKLVRAEDPKIYRRANARLGAASRALSARRDADAMLDTLAALGKHAAPARRSLAAVRRALESTKAGPRVSAAERERQLEAFARTLQEEARRLAKWEPEVDRRAVAASFGASYRRARRAMRWARKHPSAEAFHEWRKAVKVYTYQCGLLRLAWPEPMKALRGELKALGRRLGEEHDLSVLFERLGRLPVRGPGSVDEESLNLAVALIEGRQALVRREAFEAGERLFGDPPREVAARMRAWWRIARRERRQAA